MTPHEARLISNHADPDYDVRGRTGGFFGSGVPNNFYIPPVRGIRRRFNALATGKNFLVGDFRDNADFITRDRRDVFSNTLERFGMISPLELFSLLARRRLFGKKVNKVTTGLLFTRLNTNFIIKIFPKISLWPFTRRPWTSLLRGN